MDRRGTPVPAAPSGLGGAAGVAFPAALGGALLGFFPGLLASFLRLRRERWWDG